MLMDATGVSIIYVLLLPVTQPKQLCSHQGAEGVAEVRALGAWAVLVQVEVLAQEVLEAQDFQALASTVIWVVRQWLVWRYRLSI